MTHDEWCETQLAGKKYCYRGYDKCSDCKDIFEAGMREGYEMARKTAYVESMSMTGLASQCSARTVMNAECRTYDEAIAANDDCCKTCGEMNHNYCKTCAVHKKSAKEQEERK